jgi:23S rRNA (guanine745-N1)-methyltransferase
VIADVLDALRCPKGEPSLALVDGGLECEAGHRFDLARQGYVNLLDGPAPAAADTAAMVAARDRVHAAGHLGALTRAVVAAVVEATSTSATSTSTTAVGGGDGVGLVLDLGAGTGHHLAAVLDTTEARAGLALDLSKHAARRAARAHPRVGAVVADVWRPWPVRDRAAAVVLDVFSPRNPGEIGRVLRPGGVLVVVTPDVGHLDPLPDRLGLLGVGGDKTERLDADLGGVADLVARRRVDTRVTVDTDGVRDLALMGPSAHHLDVADLDDRIAQLGERVEVTVAVTLSVLRRRAS